VGSDKVQLRDTVSFAYQIVLAVGFMMEIAAGCELGLDLRTVAYQ
jgi:hypothetical protein